MTRSRKISLTGYTKADKYFRLFLVFTPFLLGFTLAAQSPHQNLAAGEQYIQQLFQQVKQAASDNERIIAGDTIFSRMQRLLTRKESFTYPFDALLNIGKLTAMDSSLRIINWNIPLTSGEQQYYLLIQKPLAEGGGCTVIPLTKRSSSPGISEEDILAAKEWYGAVYYQLLVTPTDTGRCYTLLGLDFNNLFTTRKVIDILSFDTLNQPVFGAPLFVFPDHTASRVVFEYSARVSMMMRYDTTLRMIVLDHLSPSKPGYEGLYQFYGPDFSYDGFVLSKGKWIYRKDLDLRNQELP